MKRKRKNNKMSIETIDQYIQISSDFVNSEIEIFKSKEDALEYINSLYGSIEGTNDDISEILNENQYKTYVRYFFQLSNEDYENVYPLGADNLYDYEYMLQTFLNKDGEEITDEEDLNEENLVKTIRVFNITLMALSDITKKKEDEEVGLIIECWNDVMDDEFYTAAIEEEDNPIKENLELKDKKKQTPKNKKKTVEEYEKELKAAEKLEQFEQCIQIKKKIDKLLASKKKK